MKGLARLFAGMLVLLLGVSPSLAQVVSKPNLLTQTQQTLYGQGQGYLDTGALGRLIMNIINSFTGPPVINVVDSGAICDDVHDDTGALNTAGVTARTLASAGYGFKIVFPQGVKCKVAFPGVNWTNLNVYPGLVPGVIDGNGATIDGQVQGAAVVDLLGSTTITVRDLKILGAGSVYPTTGIQYGRVTSGSADRNQFDNVQVQGVFSLAACLNNASEDWTGVNVKCYNSGTTSTAWAAVFDGSNSLGLTSQFVTITDPTNTAGSLQHAVCLGCDFRQNAAGSTLYLSNTYGFRIYGGYLLNQATQSPVVLNTTYGVIRDTHVDAHMENVTIPSNFLITGSATPSIQGLELQENVDFATNAVVALDAGVTSATIFNLHVNVSLFNTGAAKLFDTAANYTIIGGVINLPNVNNWATPASNSAQVAFSGIILPGSGATWNVGGGTNTAPGQNSTVSGGAQNTSGGSGSAVTGGVGVVMNGSFSRGGGDDTRDNSRIGMDCYGSNNTNPGQFQTCHAEMSATGTAAMTLTVNRSAGSTSNEFNIPTTLTDYGFSVHVLCRDLTSVGNDVYAIWHALMLSRDSAANAITLTGFSATPDISRSRGTSSFTWSMSADTTNYGLIITATPPNSDTWHCAAEIGPDIEVNN